MALSRCLQSLAPSCLPVLHAVVAQQQHLMTSTPFSSDTSTTIQQNPEDSMFIGAYTPVTRQLWQNRLKLAQQQQGVQPGAAGSAAAGATQQVQDALEARPPKRTVINYPFSTDRVLLELVSVYEAV